MLPAERAILLHFHSVRMVLLLLRGVVVAPFALRAGKCDLGSHSLLLSSYFLAFLHLQQNKNSFGARCLTNLPHYSAPCQE